MATQQEKEITQHNELARAATDEPSPKVIAGFAAADQEVAQYLDPTVVIDDETNRRIKSLINRRILPFLVITYFFQTFDKGTLAFSAVMGIREDLRLTGQQYPLLGTILYVGILIGEIPANRFIQIFPIAKMLGMLVITWGALVMCHAACKSWSSLMAVRFFLGLMESAVQPTLMTLTVMYYRREEHPLVISWWYCQQGVQLGVAGLLAFGLTYVQNAPIYPWQALFIVVGGLTVIWGVLILIFLPDSPMRAKCFDDRTKTLILERLRVNELGVQNKKFSKAQMFEAFRDPVVWVYLVLQFSCFIITNGLATFSNIIVNNLGFNVRQTQLLNLAQGAWSIMVFIGSAWLAKKTQQTCLVLILFMAIAMAGTIVLVAVPTTPQNAPGMLIAFYLANFVIASGNLLWSLVTRNIAGQSKKVTTYTMMFLSYATGAIVGPQVFTARDAPRYIVAFSAHVGIYAFFILLTIVLRLMLMRRNATRRKAAANESGDEAIRHDNAFQDLTDLQNKASFRYMY